MLSIYFFARAEYIFLHVFALSDSLRQTSQRRRLPKPDKCLYLECFYKERSTLWLLLTNTILLTSCTRQYIFQVILRHVQHNTSYPLYYMPHVRVYKNATRVLK